MIVNRFPLVTDRVQGTYQKISYGIKFWPSAMRRPQHATALAPVPLQLCPHRARAAEPTPCPSEFRRAGFRARMLDGYRGDSVPRSFLTRKFDADLRICRRHKTRPPSSSRVRSSACRATTMVLTDHSSAQPGYERVHGRIRRGPNPGHFTAAAAVISPLGSGTWAQGRGRQDVAVEARSTQDVETAMWEC